jgi:hypothetical protein
MNKKHPKALPYLFLSEMWERFGFYLMLGIFFLYMTDTQKGGMAMVGERGPELMYVPNNALIAPAGDTKSIQNGDVSKLEKWGMPGFDKGKKPQTPAKPNPTQPFVFPTYSMPRATSDNTQLASMNRMRQFDNQKSAQAQFQAKEYSEFSKNFIKSYPKQYGTPTENAIRLAFENRNKNKSQGEIKKAGPEQSWHQKLINAIANPMTVLKQATAGDHFDFGRVRLNNLDKAISAGTVDRNRFDKAFDVTPSAMVASGYDLVSKDVPGIMHDPLNSENYKAAGWDLLGAIPGFGGETRLARSGIRGVRGLSKTTAKLTRTAEKAIVGGSRSKGLYNTARATRGGASKLVKGSYALERKLDKGLHSLHHNTALNVAEKAYHSQVHHSMLHHDTLLLASDLRPRYF